MEIFGETIERELPDLAKQGVRTRFIGRRDRAPRAAPATDGGARGGDRGERPAARSGSRSTTAAAPRSSRPRGGSSRRASTPDDVDEDALAAHLYAPEMPDPDLLIRTSGELRVSNFLLWQLAYAELVFVDTLWPDFGERELRSALADVRAPPPPLRRPMSHVLVAHRSWRSSACPVVLGARLARRLVAVRRSRWSRRWSRCTSSTRWRGRCGRSSSAGYAGAIAGAARRPARRAGLDARRLHAHARRSRSCSTGSPRRAQPATVAIGDDGARRGLDRARARPPAARARHPRARPARGASRSCSRSSRPTPPRTSVGRLVGRHKLAPVALAGEDVGGVRRRHASRRCSSPSSRSTRTATTSSRSGRRSPSGVVIALAAPRATSSSRRSSATCR